MTTLHILNILWGSLIAMISNISYDIFLHLLNLQPEEERYFADILL
jgi:hypothetical protein